MTIKCVFWRAPVEPHTFYFFRLLWNRGEIGHKLSVSLRPKMWQVGKDFSEWWIVVLGVRVHYKSGYGRFG